MQAPRRAVIEAEIGKKIKICAAVLNRAAAATPRG
jgi:hypothetical protein